MSNPSGDISDTVSDVIGSNNSNSGESGAPGPPAEGLQNISGNVDLNARNKPVIPRNDRTQKLTTYKPTRTSSAPPEEHVGEVHKMHFQPTKTHQSLSHNEAARKPSPAYQNRLSAGNNSRPLDEASPNRSQAGAASDTTSSTPVMAPTPTESSNNSSAAPSPKVGAAAPGTMSLDAAQHSPLSPAATPPGVGAHDRSSPHGQGSPNFPNNMNRGFRSNNGAPGNSYRDNQYNSNNRQGGQGGQGGGGGVRNANRRPPMQQTSFPRGAGMVDGHMPHMGGQPQQMQMHGGGVRDMNRGGGVGYGSHQQLPPPQLQQQQFIAYDPYNPQMVVPNQMPQGQYGIPGAMSGGMPVGGMQGFQTQPHQQLPQGRQQSASPLQQQQQMFVPPGQQQHPQQQMVYPQHVMMHNSQPGQQRFVNQQVFMHNGTFVEFPPDPMNGGMMNPAMMDVQNMRMQGMGGPMQMQMQMMPGSYPMNMMTPQLHQQQHQQHQQQFQAFQQMPPHMAQHAQQQMYMQQQTPEMMQYATPQGHMQVPIQMVPGGGPQQGGMHMTSAGVPVQGSFVNYQHPPVIPAPHPGGPYNPNAAQVHPQQQHPYSGHGGPGGRPPQHMGGGGPPPAGQAGPGQPHEEHKHAAHLQRSPPPPRGAPPPHSSSPSVGAPAPAGAGGGVPAGGHPHPSGPAAGHTPQQPTQRHTSSAGSTMPSTPGTTTPVALDNQDKESVVSGSMSETASNADSITAGTEPYQQPARERKVLTFKKKDGSALDINTLRKAGSETEVSSEGKSSDISAAAPAVPAESIAAVQSVPARAPASALTSSPAEPAHAEPVPEPTLKTAPAESSAPAPAEVSAPGPAVVETAAPAVPVVPVAPVVPVVPVVIAVPTVQEQLKVLQIEGPSKEEPVSTVMEAVSPIRIPSVPVSLCKEPAMSAYSTTTVPTTVPSVGVATASEPVIVPSPREVPSAPVSSPNLDVSQSAPGTLTPLTSRSKKSVKKEQWAKADLAAGGASTDLSAYTDSTNIGGLSAAPAVSSVSATATATAQAAPASSTPKAAPKTAAPVPVVADTLPDSWDDAELNVPTLPPPEAVATKEVRSLRPGGNRGFSMNLHQAVTVTRFTKQEIIAMKPTEKFANPLSMYGSITTGEPGSTPQKGGGGGGGDRGGNQWSKGGRDGRGHGQGQDGSEGWKRGDNMPPAPSSGNKHKKSNSNVPMPKKQISDPMSLLATETMAILNKITPQSFEKLSQNMLTLNVQNIAQMSKVIELIFEKAVQEQGFANLYAELCAFLNARALHWAFYTVFRVVGPELAPDAASQYFWIRECTFPNAYAGPFFSLQECVSKMYEPTLPPMQPLTSTLETVECLLLALPDLLIKISRNDKSQGYYVTYMPFSEFGPELRSQNTFADPKLALKDAKNKNYFRAKLVNNCQTEFQLSTQNESMYGELEQEKARLLAQKAEISEADFFYKTADIEDRRCKLKRRMLGNIRFVGELFKQKLLTDVTIQACIDDLMGSPDQWKVMSDEQDIECLCHLLRTVGERLEIKNSSNAEALRSFNMYFDRIRALSRDKTLNSRMRFALEEVLMLRESGWQSRRGEDGPLKISEIHRKIQEEQTVQQFHPQQGGGHPRQGGGGGGPPMKGGGAPQQQQGQGPQRSILTRPPRSAQDVRQDVRKGAGGGGGADGVHAPVDADRFGRTMSASLHEGGRGGDYSPATIARNGPPQGGDALRRVQSEYSPSSGTATPTSLGGDGRGHVSTASDHSAVPMDAQEQQDQDLDLDFNDKKMANRAKSTISEFLEQRDVTEVKLFLSEGPRGVAGYFVLQLVDKCLNSTKEAVVSSLLALLGEESLADTFRAAQAEVFQALRTSEELRCLVDTTMDMKEAPERFASAIAALMKVGALCEAEVQQIVQEARSNCIEELMSAEEDCNAVFDRFAKQLSAERNS